MGIGASGQIGEPARRIGHVDMAKIRGQEVAMILPLLTGGETAPAVVLKLKVLFIPYTMQTTRRGWCPRTGKGQRLMFKEAVRDAIHKK